MREMQEKIISDLGVKPEINAAEEAERRIQFLADYLISTGAKGYVLGISGGVDSTLGGKLAQLAVEHARKQGHSAEFVAVRLPHHIQHDESDAQAALDFIAPDRRMTFNIGPATDAFEKEYDLGSDTRMSDYNKGNAKARMRMMAQYAVAGDSGLLVVGTDHAAEAVTGFYTKYGDGGFDVTPMSGLNKRQVKLLTKELGGPEFLWNKVPTADLLDNNPGQTDEAELGMTYEDIDDYLEGKEISAEAAERLEWYYMRSRHKRHTPATVFDSWWK